MSDGERPRRERYSEEEVKAILEYALTRQGREFTRQHLEEMASELGISPAELRDAEDAWRVAQVEERARQEFIAYRRRRYVGRLASLLLTVSVLGVLVVFKTPLATIAMIFLFITFFSGLEILDDTYDALFRTEGDKFEKQFDKWLEKREQRRRKRLERGL